MSETQQSVGQWIDSTFPGTNPNSPRKSLRALEEMVELCLASGAAPQDVSNAVAFALKDSGAKWSDKRIVGHWSHIPHERDIENIRIEAADVLIVLYGVAYMLGFDLHAEVDKKMAVNRARKWQARGDGTGYHVK